MNITLTKAHDGLYEGSDGRLYAAVTRGKTNPRITGFIEVFAAENGEAYSVPGESRFIEVAK